MILCAERFAPEQVAALVMDSAKRRRTVRQSRPRESGQLTLFATRHSRRPVSRALVASAHGG
jgi:hypothetical protein